MEGAGDDGLRGRWKAWAENTLGGSETQIEAATEAVMSAIRAGASQEEAVARARAVWDGREPPPAPAEPAAPPVPASAAPAPSSAPRAGAPDAAITGRVVGFQARNEMYARTYIVVWDFRIERPGAAPIAVEMRGFAFDGAVANGDEVRIAATQAKGGIVHVNSLENLTSNATVRVTRGPISISKGTGRAIQAVFVVFFLIVLAVGAITAFSGGGP